MNKIEIKNLSGITLIETILYLGIAVIVLGVLFSYGWNILGMGIKSKIVRETQQSAQLVGQRLAYEIRRADSVDNANSEFGNPAKLTLLTADSTVVIEYSGNNVTIKRGSAEPISLNSRYIRINDFVLTPQVSDTGEVQYVGFSFEAAADYPGSANRSEYQYSLDFNSGAALRK